jgi:D-alanyl-D-alanine carboxypeptidase
MKKLLILINCFIILLTLASPVAYAEEGGKEIKTKNGYYDIEAPDYETEIALLVNADTDTVIYSKNAERKNK